MLLLTFPVRVFATVFLTLFDFVISRWLVALPFVALLWLPLHFAIGLGIKYLLFGTIAVGTMLAGLWDGCSIFVMHPNVPKWLYFAEPLPLCLQKVEPDDARESPS